MIRLTVLFITLLISMLLVFNALFYLPPGQSLGLLGLWLMLGAMMMQSALYKSRERR